MIDKKTNYSPLGYLYLFLFLVSPFIMSANDDDKASLLHIQLLPPMIAQITGYIRWSIFGITVLYFFLKFKSSFLEIDKSFLLISLFYFIQLIYALVSNTDVIRYLSLTVISATLPFFVYSAIRERGSQIVLYSKYIVIGLLILSIALNISMISSGFRFQGFLNNPNLYGMNAVFWITILLLPIPTTKTVLFNIFIIIALVTIVLSGSRNALVCAIAVLIFFYRSDLKDIFLPLIILVGICYVTLLYIELPEFTNRLLNIGEAVYDSGRYQLWERVFGFFEENILWGHGMDANMRLVGTGNMHNCYLRYVLNMGLIFTLLSFAFYIVYLGRIFLNIQRINGALIGFIVAFTFANFGEDFYVGIGSSLFCYFCIIIGFIISDLTKLKN